MLWSTLLLSLCCAQAPWHQVYQRATTRVWSRPHSVSKGHELRAERCVDAPPERVWEVLNDLAHYPEFMPYVVDARLVASRQGHRYEYFRLRPPVIKARDYTVQIDRCEKPAAHHYSKRWHTANQEGPPPRRDSVRLDLCSGSWTVEPAEGGNPNRSRIAYWLHTDPAGAVPAWLAHRASTTSIPELLEAVAKRSLDPQWVR